ncbi:putative Thioredoxin-like superfamily [Plasmopara halstedii]
MNLQAKLGVLCLCCASWWRNMNALETFTSTAEFAFVESSAKLHALLILSTDEKNQEMSLEDLYARAYPVLPEVEKQLEGLVAFGVVDIASRHEDSIGNKWKLKSLPAFVIYKGPPKENPYTGKIYRDSKVIDIAILDNARKLKKMLKQAIPTEFVQELKGDEATMTGLEKRLSEKQDDESMALLLSEQKHASPMYRALAAEFYGQGVNFVFLSHVEEGAKDIMTALKIEELPSLVMLRSMTESVTLMAENTKTYEELKGFVQPFAIQSKDPAKKGSKQGKEDLSFVKFLSRETFGDVVLRSDVIWIIEFMDAEREQELNQEEWREMLMGLHRKAGVVSMGAVSCVKEIDLCEQYGGPGIRIFPLELAADNKLMRGDVDPQTYTTINEAIESAIAAIPDLTVVINSAPELNGFISRARHDHALPTLFFTTKKHTPPMAKALLLSVPTQKIMLAVIYDANDELKKQFSIKPSASTSLVCLVPSQAEIEDQKSTPFGIVAYDKKRNGPYNYPNVIQFILQVLAQFPHPQDTEPDSKTIDFSSIDETSAQTLVPYITRQNMADLCGGNKICAIGFFEDHVDTISDTESRLAKWLVTFAHVAAQSKQNKEPFHFMWVNGKCQKAFAEAFGVGLFQMPTLAVYSPSKQRYATNVGLFDEENAAAFLKSVLSGRISTAPIGNVPEFVEECSFEEIQEVAADTNGIADDEDLDDMLSEILSEEKQQREELEKMLKSQQKEKRAKKNNKKSKKKHKEQKKKSKKKKGSRDEL